MRNLEVNLDPFITLNKLIPAPLTNPLHLLSHFEASGTAGVSFTFDLEAPCTIEVADIRALCGCRLNIRTNCDLQSVQKVVQLQPDAITLIDKNSKDQTLDAQSPECRDMVDLLQSTQESELILRIQPDIKQLKAAYKLKVDAVELATNSLAFQNTYQNYIVVLDNLIHAIRVGQKNKLRVSVGGNLDIRIITSILELVDVEFISVGKAILARSLIEGFYPTLKKFVDIINYI